MRKSNLISTAFVACGCLLFLFAGSVVGAVNCEKKPDHPRCNDGGDGGEGGGDHPVNLTFRDAGTDRIRSDVDLLPSGTVTYTDGEPGVSARFRDDGILLVNIETPDRGLELDFSAQSQDPDCGTTGCKKDFESVNTLDYSSGAAVTVQVFDNGTSQHRADQFLGMDIGETLLGEMKIGFGGSRNSTRYSVRFQALGVGAIDEAISVKIGVKSSFLEITRTTQDTWFIEAVDPSAIGAGNHDAHGNHGDQALLYSKFKQKGTVFQDEGTYHMPFGLIVECQSNCPLP